MPRTGIEPVIFALRVRRLTTWPTGPGRVVLLLACSLSFGVYICDGNSVLVSLRLLEPA
jgi:hypothetical protein